MTRRNVLRCDREHRAARTWARFMGIMRAMVWLAAPALAYFVRPSAGADTNDGRAPSTAFRTIARALQAAQAGDVIYVGAGTYAESLASDPSSLQRFRSTR